MGINFSKVLNFGKVAYRLLCGRIIQMMRLKLFIFITALEPSLPWKCGIKQEEVTLSQQ
jgi:hypothetical protein